MTMPSLWLAPVIFAAGCSSVAFVAPVQAQDNPVLRMRVDSPEVVVLDGTAYYRGDDDRPEVRRDAYGRPIYFRFIPLDKHPMRNDSSSGDRYDARRDRPQTWRNDGDGNATCNRHGDCSVEYYDRRHDRDGEDRRGRDGGDCGGCR